MLKKRGDSLGILVIQRAILKSKFQGKSFQNQEAEQAKVYCNGLNILLSGLLRRDVSAQGILYELHFAQRFLSNTEPEGSYSTNE